MRRKVIPLQDVRALAEHLIWSDVVPRRGANNEQRPVFPSDLSVRIGSITHSVESARRRIAGTVRSRAGRAHKAGEVASKLGEAAQQAGSQAKQAASSLASEANQKAKGLMNQGLPRRRVRLPHRGCHQVRRRQSRQQRAANRRAGAGRRREAGRLFQRLARANGRRPGADRIGVHPSETRLGVRTRFACGLCLVPGAQEQFIERA